MNYNLKYGFACAALGLSMLGWCALNATPFFWDIADENYGLGGDSMSTNWNVPDNSGWNDPVYFDVDGDSYAHVSSKSFNALSFENALANEQGMTWEFRIRASNLKSGYAENILALRLDNDRINPATQGTADSRDFQVYFDSSTNTIVARNYVGTLVSLPVNDVTEFQTYRFILDDSGYVTFQQMGSESIFEVQARGNRTGSGFGPYFQAGSGGGVDWDIDYLRISSSAIPEPALMALVLPAVMLLLFVRIRRKRNH